MYALDPQTLTRLFEQDRPKSRAPGGVIPSCKEGPEAKASESPSAWFKPPYMRVCVYALDPQTLTRLFEQDRPKSREQGEGEGEDEGRRRCAEGDKEGAAVVQGVTLGRPIENLKLS